MKKTKVLLLSASFLLAGLCLVAQTRPSQPEATPGFQSPHPQLTTQHPQLDSAFRLALWTIDHNTHQGLLHAGAGYGGEWTRDASINAWNGVSLLRPHVAEQTLWNVTEPTEHGVHIGHQYWDKIIWTLAAWNHYQTTGDTAYLRSAYLCAQRTMQELEDSCYDPAYQLFFGPALFQDGIEAYPEPIFDTALWDQSYVLTHPHSDSLRCLSTNILYRDAYNALAQMSSRLGEDDGSQAAHYRARANQLGAAILRHLYDSATHHFYYLVDHRGVVQDYQEGIGVSLALMGDLLPNDEAQRAFRALRLTPYGIPSVSPSFARNSAAKPGRHNMMIWPHINAFYAHAAAQKGEWEAFYREVENIARLAMQNGKGNFYEIYTLWGEPSGGWQCRALWDTKPHQTWCATGYLHLWLADIFGLQFDGSDQMTISPHGMSDGSSCTLSHLQWRGTDLTLTVEGTGPYQIAYLNGTLVPAQSPLRVPAHSGAIHLHVRLSQTPN